MRTVTVVRTYENGDLEVKLDDKNGKVGPTVRLIADGQASNNEVRSAMWASSPGVHVWNYPKGMRFAGQEHLLCDKCHLNRSEPLTLRLLPPRSLGRHPDGAEDQPRSGEPHVQGSQAYGLRAPVRLVRHHIRREPVNS